MDQFDRRSCRLTIFEGPDGSGKTTAAKSYARLNNARYVHFGPLVKITKGLARLYVEAMMPALLGYQDVVFDRCWLSEVPYGLAFRNGEDRLGDDQRRMLERLALRCGAVVVKCLPPWATVRGNYLSRKEIEYLENEDQLMLVYGQYQAMATALPVYNFDYTASASGVPAVNSLRGQSHSVSVASAGNALAKIVLVGENFTEPCEHDPLYQWPFASFTGSGCSQWLTQQLHAAGIRENQLCWVNADQNLEEFFEKSMSLSSTVFALGDVASTVLNRLGQCHVRQAHPQYWKRFRSAEPYPLIGAIKEVLNA